ncbi:unnamed protein product [Ceutorhynchus assimilis]|uniref:Uncharacterized protein n=1 Tax=Ceutorhynchus assimilis TaxID=467358 RepID=A0A9N9QNF1_9CUCU|nr:unnamed protein product [Ceutorhynchus assimilis]
MCHSKKVKTPVTAPMAKFVVILVAVFLSAECAAGRYEIKKSRGSCLSYGHACWGAHGKRSGSQEALAQRMDNEATSGDEAAKAEWFLSKIISPLDFRFYRDAANNDLNAPKPEIDDLFTDIDNENIKSGNELEKIRQIIKNNRLAMDNPRNIDVIKVPKFLEKRSTKLQ